MKKLILWIPLFMAAQWAWTQDKPAYQIYTGNGNEVRYSRMMKEIEKADFIFFGELHNNAIAHWLQHEVTRDLFAADSTGLILGAEMFEADNQVLIQEYWDGFINGKKFEEDARLWKNYPTDYKPLLEFARQKGLPFIATNVPRRYASLVASKGLEVLDSMSAEAKAWLPPLPIEFDPEVPCYKNMLKMMGGGGGMAAHGGTNLMKAQALKDATMAWFIHKNFKEGDRFIHFNGSYHSDSHEGIVWYLRKYYPEVKIVVITTITQEDISKLDDESKGKADYVIAVPERMTNTY